MTVTRPSAVVILAAGEGTRMRSATPKVLHTIAGRSLLGHVVEAASSLEPAHLVVVVGHLRLQGATRYPGLRGGGLQPGARLAGPGDRHRGGSGTQVRGA